MGYPDRLGDPRPEVALGEHVPGPDGPDRRLLQVEVVGRVHAAVELALVILFQEVAVAEVIEHPLRHEAVRHIQDIVLDLQPAASSRRVEGGRVGRHVGQAVAAQDVGGLVVDRETAQHQAVAGGDAEEVGRGVIQPGRRGRPAARQVFEIGPPADSVGSLDAQDLEHIDAKAGAEPENPVIPHQDIVDRPEGIAGVDPHVGQIEERNVFQLIDHILGRENGVLDHDRLAGLAVDDIPAPDRLLR